MLHVGVGEWYLCRISFYYKKFKKGGFSIQKSVFCSASEVLDIFQRSKFWKTSQWLERLFSAVNKTEPMFEIFQKLPQHKYKKV